MLFLTHNHELGTFSARGLCSRSGAERGVLLAANTPVNYNSASQSSPAASFLRSRQGHLLICLTHTRTHTSALLMRCCAPQATPEPLSHASVCVQLPGISLFVMG